MPILLAVYFGVGAVLSIWVLATRKTRRSEELSPLLFLGDAMGLFLFLLWPLWLLVQLADRGIEAPAAPPEYVSEDLTGRTGEVALELRPTGRVRIDGKFFEARSNGDLLPVGTRIVVIGHRLGELTVEKAVRV